MTEVEIVAVSLAAFGVIVSLIAIVIAVRAKRKAAAANIAANDLIADAEEIQARLVALEDHLQITEHGGAELEMTLVADRILIQNRGGGDATDVEWQVMTEQDHDVTIAGTPTRCNRIPAGDSWEYRIARTAVGEMFINIAWSDDREERHHRESVQLIEGSAV